MCRAGRGEVEALSPETACPGGWGGPGGWETPGGWKEWIDEVLDPGSAQLGSGRPGGPWQFWATVEETLKIFQRVTAWHALSEQHQEQFESHH